MRAARPVAAAASALAALFLSFVAWRQGEADTLVGQVSDTFESAAWREAPPQFDTWLSLRAKLLEAQSLTPRNPGVLEGLGVLHERRAASRDMLLYARDYFARSLEVRPASPYAWANLAAVRYELGDTGAAFEGALVRAVELGPWEPEVQRVVADVGLAVLEEVQPATRAAIERAVGFAMRRDPVATLQVAERRGRLDVACRHVAGNRRVTDAKWNRLCEKKDTT